MLISVCHFSNHRCCIRARCLNSKPIEVTYTFVCLFARVYSNIYILTGLLIYLASFSIAPFKVFAFLLILSLKWVLVPHWSRKGATLARNRKKKRKDSTKGTNVIINKVPGTVPTVSFIWIYIHLRRTEFISFRCSLLYSANTIYIIYHNPCIYFFLELTHIWSFYN